MKSFFINGESVLIRNCETALGKCKIAKYMRAGKYTITTDGDKVMFIAPYAITSTQCGLRVIGMIKVCEKCGRDPMVRELQTKQKVR